MPTLLLTGFEPFHTHPVNPSAQAAEALHGLTVGDWQVHAALLPVDPGGAAAALTPLLDELQPAAVLLTGLAVGRPQVTLERVAVNVMDFPIPDNTGQTYRDAPVCAPGEEGAAVPAAYLSTLPLRDLLAAWRDAEVPGSISNSAGLYVCNAVMFHALHHLHRSGRAAVPCGFLHLPANAFLAAEDTRLPYLPQAEITRAVQVAAQTLMR